MAEPTTPSPRLSVVVPLFNEEDSVALLVNEIGAALEGWDFELVLVDDDTGAWGHLLLDDVVVSAAP